MKTHDPQNPPPFARWVLEHLTICRHNHALAGDLQEEYQSGRSPSWYRKQVLGVLGVSATRILRVHSLALVFAAFWSMLSPLWVLAIATFEKNAKLDAAFWQMTWPWSVISELGLLLAANVLFIWLGISLYLAVNLLLTRELHLRRIAGGIANSLPALVVVWLALIVLPKVFLAGRPENGPAFNRRFEATSPVQAPTQTMRAELNREYNPGWPFARVQPALNSDQDQAPSGTAGERTAPYLLCLPFFLAVLCTLWGVSTPQPSETEE